MPTIAFASSKGGAGKTTSSIILGTELAAKGASVIMIDADPARRLKQWSEIRELPEGIEVIATAGERAILDEIEEAATQAAFVIIDLEGSASRLASFAVGESDFVIIPSGEEQQDANAAIDTMAEIAREARARRKEIPSAVLFCRTKAAVKSKLEKHILGEMKSVALVFETQLNTRTAFSALHNAGAGLRQLDQNEYNGVDKAMANANAFAAETISFLEDA